MIGHAAAFGAGLVFGIGLWISGMATPRKVLDFLDVTGGWDPSLALVMAGAVGVTLAGFPAALKRHPIEKRSDLNAPLIIGATIFGIGWGIGGYCPGPALTALSNLSAEAFVFVGAMVAGGLAHRLAFD